jgi:hypothetical protein
MLQGREFSSSKTVAVNSQAGMPGMKIAEAVLHKYVSKAFQRGSEMVPSVPVASPEENIRFRKPIAASG